MRKIPKQARKKVFNEFIEKTKSISQILEEGLDIRQAYEAYESINASKDSDKLGALSGNLENENILYYKLVDL